jgi:hypothetical protein
MPGEMSSAIAAFDWTVAGLGAPSGWPQSLKTITSFLLGSPIPIVLLWGEDGIIHHGRLDPGVELITKPFSMADLAVRIRDMLDRG